MSNNYISKQDAVDAFNHAVQDVGILDADDIETVFGMLSSADVVPYSIAPDGTLIITVPKGMKRIGRVFIEEDGTRYGRLFYPDPGGCFLSSMEKE